MNIPSQEVLLAWWPYATPLRPPLDRALDAPPFLSWRNLMVEARKHIARGRTVRVLVPGSFLDVPPGQWDLTGIVLEACS